MGVAIVGAGIGGLTAALALHRRGLGAVVYEEAPELRPVGAGILVPPNGMEVLRRLGVADAVAAAGQPLEEMELHSLRGGLLQRGTLTGTGRTAGVGSVAIHRARLHQVLRDALPAAALRLDHALERMDAQGGGATLHFSGGAREAASLVIGADGLWSTVRGAVAPAVVPRPAGQTAWRGVVRGVAVPGPRAAEIWGPHGRFGFAPIGQGEVYWFAVVSAAPGAERTPAERHALLSALAAPFPAPVAALVAATDAESIIETDLYDLPPMRAWHRGSVLLLGDAAHATTPNLGQGGAQAMEDGYLLAHCLAAGGDAFAVFERMRMQRANRVVARSRAFGRVAHLSHPLAITARDGLLRLVPTSASRRQMAWLYDPDLPAG